MPAWRPNRTIFCVFRPFFDHWWGTTSPELRVPQKTAPFYKDCEQGVTLKEIFLKNDTCFSRGPDFTRIANRGSPWRKYFWKTTPFFPGVRILQGLRAGGHPDANIFEKRHPFSRGPEKLHFRKWIRVFFFTDCPYRDLQGLTMKKHTFGDPFWKNTHFWNGELGGWYLAFALIIYPDIL